MAKKRAKIKKALVKKYRLVVLTEDSYEEKFSFKLTRLNVFVFGGLFSVLLIAVTSGLIVYTSLKEYIPGFESPQLKRDVISMNFQLDSLELKMHALALYTESMKPILIGDKAIEMEELPYVTKEGESVYQSGITNNDSIHNKLKKLYGLLADRNRVIKSLQETNKQQKLDTATYLNSSEESRKLTELELKSLETSSLDSVFRAKVAQEERFSIYGPDVEQRIESFIQPVTGRIVKHFSAVEKHFGVDIRTSKKASVKAVANGVVVLSEWSLEEGYIIVLLHTNNVLSVYKHNSKLNVLQGELVKAGQVIASTASKGILNTDSYLYFEIWKDGYPVDPTNFMKF